MRKILFISIIFLSVLWQCSQSGQSKKDPKNISKKDSSLTTDSLKGKPELEQVPVEVATVSRGDISSYLLLSSNLETEIMADVYARIQGIVDSIYKEEGQYVHKNEIMLSLEAKEYQLAEQKAHLEYQNQLSNYKRLEAMHNKELLSDEEFDKARYALKTAQIQWDEAKLNLGYTKIRSPIDGRVGERRAKIGERIQPTDKLFSVVNNSQVIAVIYVPEKNLNQVKVGQRALVYSDHLKGVMFNGWIKRISPVVDPASGTFKVTVGVRNRKNMLRPGMFVNIRIIIDTHKNVVLVPKTAIVYENEAMKVYVVRDGIAYKIPLTSGYEDSDQIEVLKDIHEGDKIILVGQAGMKDRTPVKIVNERILSTKDSSNSTF